MVAGQAALSDAAEEAIFVPDHLLPAQISSDRGRVGRNPGRAGSAGVGFGAEILDIGRRAAA